MVKRGLCLLWHQTRILYLQLIWRVWSHRKFIVKVGQYCRIWLHFSSKELADDWNSQKIEGKRRSFMEHMIHSDARGIQPYQIDHVKYGNCISDAKYQYTTSEVISTPLSTYGRITFIAGFRSISLTSCFILSILQLMQPSVF